MLYFEKSNFRSYNRGNAKMTVGVTQNFLPYGLGAKLPIDREDIEGESEGNRGFWERG